jgi:hypothetical protein
MDIDTKLTALRAALDAQEDTAVIEVLARGAVKRLLELAGDDDPDLVLGALELISGLILEEPRPVFNGNVMATLDPESRQN